MTEFYEVDMAELLLSADNDLLDHLEEPAKLTMVRDWQASDGSVTIHATVSFLDTDQTHRFRIVVYEVEDDEDVEDDDPQEE